MRALGIATCVLIAVLAAPPQAAAQPRNTCVTCGKALGLEVPESPLSADPDFKQLGMFQCCQTCMDKKMDRKTQETYTKVAQKYKWNSISHNRALAFKYNRRGSM